MKYNISHVGIYTKWLYNQHQQLYINLVEMIFIAKKNVLFYVMLLSVLYAENSMLIIKEIYT